MSGSPRIARACGLLLVIALLTACGIGAPDEDELTVFAAASMTEAMLALDQAYARSTELQYNFGGSSQLSLQISQGAPADIFISANREQIQAALDSTGSLQPAVPLARNRLVLITPSSSSTITQFSDLGRPGVRLVTAVTGVPIRDYTEEVMSIAQSDPELGPDFVDQVWRNVVSEEQNVRQVTAKLALGEADAAIVYATDVTPAIADEVSFRPLPEQLQVSITIWIAPLRRAGSGQAAADFIDFCLSPTGQAILVQRGFLPASNPP